MQVRRKLYALGVRHEMKSLSRTLEWIDYIQGKGVKRLLVELYPEKIIRQYGKINNESTQFFQKVRQYAKSKGITMEGVENESVMLMHDAVLDAIQMRKDYGHLIKRKEQLKKMTAPGFRDSSKTDYYNSRLVKALTEGIRLAENREINLPQLRLALAHMRTMGYARRIRVKNGEGIMTGASHTAWLPRELPEFDVEEQYAPEEIKNTAREAGKKRFEAYQKWQEIKKARPQKQKTEPGAGV